MATVTAVVTLVAVVAALNNPLENCWKSNFAAASAVGDKRGTGWSGGLAALCTAADDVTLVNIGWRLAGWCTGNWTPADVDDGSQTELMATDWNVPASTSDELMQDVLLECKHEWLKITQPQRLQSVTDSQFSNDKHKNNKQSELMLIRRATASVKFYTVVVLVYHSNFIKNSLYKCAKMTAWFYIFCSLALKYGCWY